MNTEDHAQTLAMAEEANAGLIVKVGGQEMVPVGMPCAKCLKPIVSEWEKWCGKAVHKECPKPKVDPVCRLVEAITDAIVILESGSDYKRLHVSSILKRGLDAYHTQRQPDSPPDPDPVPV